MNLQNRLKLYSIAMGAIGVLCLVVSIYSILNVGNPGSPFRNGGSLLVIISILGSIFITWSAVRFYRTSDSVDNADPHDSLLERRVKKSAGALLYSILFMSFFYSMTVWVLPWLFSKKNLVSYDLTSYNRCLQRHEEIWQENHKKLAGLPDSIQQELSEKYRTRRQRDETGLRDNCLFSATLNTEPWRSSSRECANLAVEKAASCLKGIMFDVRDVLFAKKLIIDEDQLNKHIKSSF